MDNSTILIALGGVALLYYLKTENDKTKKPIYVTNQPKVLEKPLLNVDARDNHRLHNIHSDTIYNMRPMHQLYRPQQSVISSRW